MAAALVGVIDWQPPFYRKIDVVAMTTVTIQCVYSPTINLQRSPSTAFRLLINRANIFQLWTHFELKNAQKIDKTIDKWMNRINSIVWDTGERHAIVSLATQCECASNKQAFCDVLFAGWHFKLKTAVFSALKVGSLSSSAHNRITGVQRNSLPC